MPSEDALRFAGLDTRDHLAEKLPPRRLGAEGFFVDAHHFNLPPRGNQALHVSALGFYGDDLAVFVFAGFSAVEEISHGCSMSLCWPSRDSRRSSGKGEARTP